MQQDDKMISIDDPDRPILEMDRDGAIEQMMLKYGEEIKRLVYTYTKSWTQAEDLTQDVFVTIFMKLHSFTGRSLLRTWIYSITINKCKDYKKSWYHRNIHLADKLLSFTKSDMNTPETEMLRKDEKTLLMSHVMSLSIKYREIILLYYYKQFTIDEIAMMLNMKSATVKTRLKRAREKLQFIYEKRGEQSGS